MTTVTGRACRTLVTLAVALVVVFAASKRSGGRGRRIATSTTAKTDEAPKDVLTHPRVIQSYLGTEEKAIRRSGARRLAKSKP